MAANGANEALGKAHVPYGSDGSGLYSAATLGCFRVIQEAKPMILDALSELPLKFYQGCVRIADYGTADGGTSMPLLGDLIDTIKRNHPSTEVEVSYEDQPTNDFKSLFFFVQGLKAIENVEPYLKRHSGVFVTASGTGFYEQCFPSNSIHLGMSFTAMHWLRRKPCNITTGLHMTQAEGNELAAFAKQAEEVSEAGHACTNEGALSGSS
ncbi:S-adenosyl-L-methionine-dependent methyltransferase [Dunaliella salina]|uniref:S-adenosyl-L-methionine-dependent methyltransferase n=1 Tax=Dunaliella salina TaxID=3046 RepID=A0ABQ7H1R1_DUNSA|nr:S-adenosyl-L-methionine-dependent methyltransferase [Dunaliella salina]|eukprot:KAF5840791.1 S-adenosyl-L-methionine-dependent methyltransferase [Dunaliella salina]